ncbi:MAG: amino acid ABC transporter permease [Bacilli bacterium]
MPDFFNVIYENRILFLEGIMNTVLLTSVGLSLGLLIGLFIGMGKRSNVMLISIPSKVYIDVFRGTPLFLQILTIHFALIPMVFKDILGLPVPDAMFSGYVALTLNSAAYIAEIFRAGINSIDRGQGEASRSLGMTEKQAMRHVILPQAFKRMIPPLGNEAIALLKDSALVAIVAAHELGYYTFSLSKSYAADRWTIYIFAGLIYLCFTLLLSKLVSYLERRYQTT